MSVTVPFRWIFDDEAGQLFPLKRTGLVLNSSSNVKHFVGVLTVRLVVLGGATLSCLSQIKKNVCFLGVVCRVVMYSE
jgi:hypothetical protein